MHNIDLILTLTAGLTAALLFGLLTQRLGLSPIVGYLMAGILIGPKTPGFEANRGLAEQLAEIGIILLMFGVGLQFHLKELLAVKRIAIPGAIVQSAVATVLGAVTAHFFGWSWTAGIIFGLAISVASTVVLTRVLADNNHLQTPTGHVAIGWLVMEDLFTVFVLVLLPALFGPDKPDSLFMTIGMASIKIIVLVAIVFIIGGWGIPQLLNYIAKTRSRELFTLAVLVVALGIAVGSSLLFGVSMALGAFLAGMVVARSDFSLRAASEALPMRDAFAVLFFVSVGMLFDPEILVTSPEIVAATFLIIIVGKPAAATILMLAMRYPLKMSLQVSATLSQIGEFSFIVATLGIHLKVLPEAAMNILVIAAMLSILVNPALYKYVHLAEKLFSGKKWQWLTRGKLSVKKAIPEGPISQFSHSAIIIGFGPVGKTVERLLRENQVESTIIELNLSTVKELKKQGYKAIYGDATHSATMIHAGIEKSDFLILSSSSTQSAKEIIKEAKQHNPKIQILARTGHLKERNQLLKAGADLAFSGEGEVALSMTEFILEKFGFSKVQIGKERERIRKELFEEK